MTKPKKPPPEPHVILNANHGGRYECRHCGGHYQPTYPLTISMMTATMKAFERDHKHCKRPPEGPVCVYCGKSGHIPRECPWMARKQTPSEWLAGPGTGVSSLVICSVLHHGYPHRSPPVDVPHDPDDFVRCRRLFELFPEWRDRFEDVAERHPIWKPFVEHWDELEALYQEEKHLDVAPKLYAALRALHEKDVR